MRLLTVLLGFSALALAVISAYFSIFGLSQLFAGAYLAVIIMAASLEFAKLVTAAFLYNFWSRIKFLMKTYMTLGILILVFISSVGIYGFLTAAYQTASDKLAIVDREVSMVDARRARFQEQLDGYIEERNQITQSITNLAQGLSGGTTVQYIDPESGQLITTTSSAARSAFERQLTNQQDQRDLITQRIDALSDSVAVADIRILQIQLEGDIETEIGPLRYLSEITGRPMNLIVNWLALLFTIVFDPLAVILVIAFNMMLVTDKERRKVKKIENKDYEVYGDEKKDNNKSIFWEPKEEELPKVETKKLEEPPKNETKKVEETPKVADIIPENKKVEETKKKS